MQIGIDARFWNETGVGRYIRNLVEQLSLLDKENQYTLFIQSKDNKEFNSLEWKTKKNWKIVHADIPWHSFKEQIELPKILYQENLDLMHFPYFSIPIGYTKPFVVTIHDLILHHFATGEATTKSKLIYHAKLLGYKFIIKNAAQRAQKIIAVSQATKDEIIDHLKITPQKIEVTYEGIDRKLIKTNEKKEESQKETENLVPYFVHVGNLYPHKNPQLLIEAFKILKAQNNPTKLVIVGRKDFFHKRFLHLVQKNNLEDKIKLVGEVTDAELVYLYQHAEGLISASLMEGFDLPAVEAMANNCLVIASDIPVHREICQTAALYFQSNNTQDLVLQLNKISQAGKEGYQKQKTIGEKLSEQYSWEKMAKQTKKIYEDCVSV